MSKSRSYHCFLSLLLPPDHSHNKRGTEEKAPVILLFYYIPERTVSQELWSREIRKNCSKLHLPQGRKKSCTLAILNFCYGCSADVTGNWSGQAQLREGEGQLVHQLCCITLRTIPVMVQGLYHIWTQAQGGSPADMRQGSLNIAFWD